MSASIVSGLMEMRNTIDQILESGGLPAAATVKVNKNGKPRKESSRKGKATPHGDFTKMICEKHKDEIAAFKAANPEQKGAHLVFVSSYKKEHTEEYKAFEADWKEKHSEASDGSASSANESADEAAPVAEKEKSKRPPMSDEQKAKMKAGREAAALKKKAEAAAPAAAPAAPLEPAEPAVAPEFKPLTEPVVAAPVGETKAKKPVKVAKKTG